MVDYDELKKNYAFVEYDEDCELIFESIWDVVVEEEGCLYDFDVDFDAKKVFIEIGGCAVDLVYEVIRDLVEENEYRLSFFQFKRDSDICSVGICFSPSCSLLEKIFSVVEDKTKKREEKMCEKPVEKTEEIDGDDQRENELPDNEKSEGEEESLGFIAPDDQKIGYVPGEIEETIENNSYYEECLTRYSVCVLDLECWSVFKTMWIGIVEDKASLELLDVDFENKEMVFKIKESGAGVTEAIKKVVLHQLGRWLQFNAGDSDSVCDGVELVFKYGRNK